MTDTCPICIEPFNRTIRKNISCYLCYHSACASCYKRVFTSSYDDPACMSCKKIWSREFLVESFSKNYVNITLKKHREDILFEREQSMMPATIPYAERRKQIKDLDERLSDIDKEIRDMLKSIRTLKSMRAELQFDRYVLNTSAVNTSMLKNEQNVFTRHCPNDDCHGFLNSEWYCSLCKAYVCQECHEIKECESSHICKQENIETAKLLAKDSKPCPNCNAMSCKVQGCSQVFCIICHTAWNWNTGKIETGRIHAVDFLELQRKNGGQPLREHGDIPCGGIPYEINMIKHLESIKASTPVTTATLDVMRYVRNTWDFEAPKYRHVTNLNDNMELRCRYMLNEITKEEFKRHIYQKDIMNQKYREYYSLLTTFRDTSIDIINNIMIESSEIKIRKHLHQYMMIYTQMVDEFYKIAHKYATKVPNFILNDVHKDYWNDLLAQY